MRGISGVKAVAACAVIGLLLVPIEVDARGGGGGFGHGGSFGGHHGGAVFKPVVASRPLAKNNFRPHVARFRRGFWGWGGAGFYGDGYYPGSPYVGSAPDYSFGDVPAVDFYNRQLYTGGPYGLPLGNGYPVVVAPGYGYGDYAPEARGCSAQSRTVPNARHELSRITIVRC